jgi:hypothetical protein
MLVRQPLKPRADTVELIDFAQDRCKRHGQTAFLAEKPKVRELQMDWLRSEDLKEEEDVTRPSSHCSRTGAINFGLHVWKTGQSMNWGAWQGHHP